MGNLQFSRLKYTYSLMIRQKNDFFFLNFCAKSAKEFKAAVFSWPFVDYFDLLKVRSSF